MNNTVTQAIVLAAGRGQRMGALTDNTPKPLLTLADEYLLYRVFRQLERAGIKHIVVNCGYLGEQIVAACEDHNQTHRDIEIVCSIEGWPTLDTGGGIARAWQMLPDEPTLVVNADVLFDGNFSDITLPANSLAHLVLVPHATHQQQADFALDASGRVCVPKPSYTFSGVSLLHPEMLRYAPKQARFALRAWLEMAIAESTVTGEVFHGTWCDLGTPERLHAAEALFA